jgi:hypothetical protein
MAKREETVIVCVCERCGHDWIPRGEFEPKICPKCKSIYWDRPKRRQQAGAGRAEGA